MILDTVHGLEMGSQIKRHRTQQSLILSTLEEEGLVRRAHRGCWWCSVESFLSVHATLGLVTSTAWNWVWGCIPGPPSLKRWRQEDQKFKGHVCTWKLWDRTELHEKLSQKKNKNQMSINYKWNSGLEERVVSVCERDRKNTRGSMAWSRFPLSSFALRQGLSSK